MYDWDIGDGTFNSFQDIISDFWYNDDDVEDIKKKIDEAYYDRKLTSTQYDKLMQEIKELGADM